MEANKSDHTPTPDASDPPQWRRVLDERVADVLAAHIVGRPAAVRDGLHLDVVQTLVDVVGDADAILAEMMTKVMQLSKRPTLADVLGTLELAAAKAPTLTEGAALRDVATRFRRVYGGGR